METELKVVPAPIEDVYEDIVRVHIDHRNGTKAGNVVRIRANNRIVYRVARGSRGNVKNQISMDLATRQALGVSQNRTYKFEIAKANICGNLIWAWTATKAEPRISARLAVLSVLLGLAGLVIAIL